MSRRIACLVAAALLLGACASPPPPKEVFYRFDNPPPVQAGTPVFDAGLRVEPLRAEGILSERPVLFTHAGSPGKLEQYRYHHWSKPPAQLVTDDLIRHLQQAGVAQKVISADIRTDVDYSVDGELRRLERVIGEDGSLAVVEVLLRLQRFSTRELVLQKHYLETVAVPEASMTAIVGAMSQARQRIFERFVEDLRGL